MKVSLIIPTKNESRAIGWVLKEVPKNIVSEIIVIDGHSTDNTAQKAKKHLRPRKDKFILQKKKGFGNALLEAFKIAKGNVFVIMNGDGSHNPKDIPKLIQKIKENYSYVIASRYAKGGRSDDDTFIRFIGNRALTLLVNIVHNTNVSDSLYFFTAITREELKKLHLKSPGFELCVEVLIKARKAGLKFAEVPVVERASLSTTKVNAFWVGLRILEVILKKY